MLILNKIVKSVAFNQALRCFSRVETAEPKSEETFSRFLAEQFDVSEVKMESFLADNAQFYKFEKDHILNIMKVLNKFACEKSVILKYPKLFSLNPITIEYRANILLECGFLNQSILETLATYLPVISRKTIFHLKSRKLLPPDTAVQECLARCLSSWPTSPPMGGAERVPDTETTLHQSRMRVLTRYLELNLDLPADQFQQKLSVYPRLKHRPLRVIDQIIYILQNHLKMTNKKIISNFGILQSDPVNIGMMLNSVRSLAGVDVREIVQLKPNILNVNHKSLQKVQDTLNEFDIPLEAQRRCFDVFTLSHETVRTRLLTILNDPELRVHFHNPRILRLVFYKTKVDLRLALLRAKNKKCISLNVLSGCGEHYDSFAQSEGDESKGLDITRLVYSLLGGTFSYSQVHSSLRRHQFFTKVPLVNIQEVLTSIKQYFNMTEIFSNCQILLYPPEKVVPCLRTLLKLKEEAVKGQSGDLAALKGISIYHTEGINFAKISNFKVLSLTLYFLEKDYHFSGDGVWLNSTDNKRTILHQSP